MIFFGFPLFFLFPLFLFHKFVILNFNVGFVVKISALILLHFHFLLGVSFNALEPQELQLAHLPIQKRMDSGVKLSVFICELLESLLNGPGNNLEVMLLHQIDRQRLGGQPNQRFNFCIFPGAVKLEILVTPDTLYLGTQSHLF